ncbi:hypothetical protein [Pseudonocardia sp. 73-21]|uniref:hypothetical protein n=1 Tax=Pseudonocardia sp. 73-21 TaxID=1895809 RepID=UPI00261F086E|nr:hypothetical protein [Pseudonocardia sp. 73-21]
MDDPLPPGGGDLRVDRVPRDAQRAELRDGDDAGLTGQQGVPRVEQPASLDLGRNRAVDKGHAPTMGQVRLVVGPNVEPVDEGRPMWTTRARGVVRLRVVRLQVVRGYQCWDTVIRARAAAAAIRSVR